MADQTITDLNALAASDVASATDVLAIVDVSANETKKITVNNLVNVTPLNTLGALVIDTSKRVSYKSISADTTFTFSGAPTAGSWFSLLIHNTDSGAGHLITIPSSYSISRNGMTIYTSIPINDNTVNCELLLTWYYDGTTYILLGDSPFFSNTVGDYTVLLGHNAGGAPNVPATGADFSVFIGYNAGRLYPSAGQAVAVGYNAGYAPGGYAGTFLGYFAGYAGGGTSAVCVGYSAMKSADNGGVGNVAIGVHCLETTTTVSGTIALGYHAGNGGTDATDSVIVGDHCANGLAAINDCVFIGPRMGVSRAHTLHIGSAVTIGGTLPLIYGEFDNRMVRVDGKLISKTLNVSNLPTSASGLGAGDVWSNLGQLVLNGATALAIIADTGWTANADGGDKTSVIPSNATIAAMQAALNIVSAGLGDLLVALSNKVKALETALAAAKLPNA